MTRDRKTRQPDSGNDPVLGFRTLERSVLDDEYSMARLLVPIALHETLEAEQCVRDELERDRAKERADLQDEIARERRSQPPQSAKAEATEPTPAQEQAKQQEEWERHKAAVAGLRRYPVFQPEQAMALHGRMGRYAEDDRQRFEWVYDHMRANGHLRAVALGSDAALQRLATSQPHMAPVVEFVRSQIKLARGSRKPQRIPPLLIVGEPGIGKTHFAQALAKALDAPLSIQRLDSDLTGSLLLGSDRKWGNSQHGLLFELLVLGSAANPVIVLDEIDKVNRPSEQVQASLYSLLERVSASQVRDISLDFELDASLVTWIATANDVWHLGEPLRSRFKEFHIELPTAEQCLDLAREVMTTTIRDLDLPGFVVETYRLERHLAHLPARQIQQYTREAVARAVVAGRASLQRRDLPSSLLDADEADAPPAPSLH